MRNQLSYYEGQTVVVVGDLNNHRQVRDEHYHCFSDCAIYVYDENRRLNLNEPSTYCEHLWVRCDEQKEDDFGAGVFAGTVIRYTRKNGTEDWGVDITRSLFLHTLGASFPALVARDPAKVSIPYAQALLDELNAAMDEGRTLIAFGGKSAPKASAYSYKQSLCSVIASARLAQQTPMVSPKLSKCRITGQLGRELQVPAAYSEALAPLLRR